MESFGSGEHDFYVAPESGRSSSFSREDAELLSLSSLEYCKFIYAKLRMMEIFREFLK